jgi:hypothetical protein
MTGHPTHIEPKSRSAKSSEPSDPLTRVPAILHILRPESKRQKFRTFSPAYPCTASRLDIKRTAGGLADTQISGEAPKVRDASCRQPRYGVCFTSSQELLCSIVTVHVVLALSTFM